jgi:acetyltransferase-like isoleucine patch superfamily enzyme
LECTKDLIEGILRWKYRKWERPLFDEKGLTKWSWMVQYPENLQLGKLTDIGAFTYINAEYGVLIEDFVQIGSHSAIYSFSSIDGRKGKVSIKRNARVGSHCIIMPGVTIGENAIIGSFSFVDRDVPSNVIAFGTPVRVKRELTKGEIAAMLRAMEEVSQ